MPTKLKIKPSEAASAVKTYLDRIEKDLRAGKATEHTHRAALSSLLNALMPGTDATNEPKRGKYGAPDYVIQKEENGVDLTLGYTEAKDVGVSLSDSEKSEQLERYRAALPNLLLTDYLEFRWYVNGEKQPQDAMLAHWDGKKLNRTADGPANLLSLLTSFASQKPEAIDKAEELAQRMARLTHLIRNITLEVLLRGEASETLKDLLSSFRQTVLPSLTNEDFADMYAQTLAYGLFAARVNHARTGSTTPFTRQDAGRNIPKINRLLQRLFYTLTGPELDEEPFVNLVDELAQVLAYADMEKVLAEFGTQERKEDPIVHFYENFLAQYNPRLREQRGVYYTPTPVVDYIVRSVDALLVRDFGLNEGLGNTEKATFPSSDTNGRPIEITAPRLLITDPATGTATFPYQIIRLLRERYNTSGNAGQWSSYARDHLLHALYGFEIMMAPYAIAHLKISMELGGLDLPNDTEAEQEEREALSVQLKNRLNIYLTNTLEDPKHEIVPLKGPFKVISDEAQLAGKIKEDYPIMVVLGNPPYSGHSANKNQWIDDLLKGIRRDPQGRPLKGRSFSESLSSYYEVDGQPLGERNPKWLQDDYVKFIRWAQWRIEKTGAGIVAFITPHGYLDNPTFRGMRQSLSRTFDEIYVLDLHGNTNKKEVAPNGSADQNVFDIRTGVAIGIFVRKQGAAGVRQGKVYRADLWGNRQDKYDWLLAQDVISGDYKEINPSKPMYLWADQNELIRDEYEKGWSLISIAPLNVMGFQTHRDDFAIAFDRTEIEQRAEDLRGNETDIAIAERYNLKDNRDWQLVPARVALKANKKWSQKVREVAYRPFDTRWSYFGSEVMDYPRRELLEHVVGRENLNLGVGRQGSAIAENEWQLVTISTFAMDANIYRRGGVNVFPLYLYPPPAEGLGLHAYDFPVDARGRTPNLSKAFIASLSAAVGLTFSPDGMDSATTHYTPEDVFYYIYAVLHSPSYRERYAELLRTDFPRIPLPDSSERFRELGEAGKQLADLHLLKTAPKLGGFPKAGNNEVATGYPKYTPPGAGEATGKVLINPEQWFTEVKPEVWDFRVGGYQVAEKWLKDRRKRVLSFDDIAHYQRILGALANTLELQKRIDNIAKEFWNPNSIESLLSNFPKISSTLYDDVDKILHNSGLGFDSELFRAISEIFKRVSLITNDKSYAEKWFYLINPSLGGKTPIDLIKALDLDSILDTLDKLELNLDTTEAVDA